MGIVHVESPGWSCHQLPWAPCGWSTVQYVQYCFPSHECPMLLAAAPFHSPDVWFKCGRADALGEIGTLVLSTSLAS